MSLSISLCFIAGAFILFKLYRRFKDRRLIETVTALNRGEWAERNTVLMLLKMGIDHRAIFHDCYIKKASGAYTQVDLVVATKAGLLVFEIKDYSGWIFGHFRQKYWTQVLAYGKEKHRFYNPIMQNNGHIQAIRENLPNNPSIPIYSIIVFFGNNVLRDVTISSDYDYIIHPKDIKRTVNEILAQPNAKFGNKYEIMNVLTDAVLNGNNPEIVALQMETAKLAARNRPFSHYSYYFRPLFRIKQPNPWR
ncbi:MAG: NERD domain-containing protein [Staphylococcus sp.]|nr:NERD domain-containing protein [Staphylococcus sp.]